jgi:CRP/FNR family cyclic AMP-dependent transcriptional regulator
MIFCGKDALMADSARLAFDPDAFNARHGGVTICRYGDNRTIYAQGSPAGNVFFIQKGQVKLTVLSEQGKERVVAILEAGDFCGEGCLADQLLFASTATTMTECAIVRLERAAVARALHEDTSFAEFFVSYLLARNARLTEDLIHHLFDSSERRLARVLLMLADHEKHRQKVLLPKIDQQTLAKMVGTTRSRVNYFMNKFRRLGFIEYNGHIKVDHSLLNAALHDRSQMDA